MNPNRTACWISCECCPHLWNDDGCNFVLILFLFSLICRDSEASFELGGASSAAGNPAAAAAISVTQANNGPTGQPARNGFSALANERIMSPIDVNGRGGSVSSNEKSFAEELLALNCYGTGTNSGATSATTADQDQAKIAYLQLRLQDALRQLANEKQYVRVRYVNVLPGFSSFVSE